MDLAVAAFLLGFPALFSIVNPISGALIFQSVTSGNTPVERRRMARRVARNSLLVMMVALWAGSYVLAFFGITIAALRVAGGLVVAYSGWDLMNTPERQEARKQEQAVGASNAAQEDKSMFPLTIPITTGPGTIAVSVALGAGHPKDLSGLGPYFIGMTGAAVALSAVIWVAYHFADRLTRLMSPTGTRTVTRIAAFLLLCIGVQILITGVNDVLGPLLTQHS